MKLNTIILMCFMLVFVTACSSVGKTHVTQAKRIQIKAGSSVALTVNSPDNISTDQRDSYMEVTQRLEGQLFGRLMNESGFKQVVHKDETADYKLEVNLLEADEVSQGARIFFGVFAGANKLNVNATLFDTTSQQVVTSFEVSGESASHPLSSENDMDDAIREVVDEIVLMLR